MMCPFGFISWLSGLLSRRRGNEHCSDRHLHFQSSYAAITGGHYMFQFTRGKGHTQGMVVSLFTTVNLCLQFWCQLKESIQHWIALTLKLENGIKTCYGKKNIPSTMHSLFLPCLYLFSTGFWLAVTGLSLSLPALQSQCQEKHSVCMFVWRLTDQWVSLEKKKKSKEQLQQSAVLSQGSTCHNTSQSENDNMWLYMQLQPWSGQCELESGKRIQRCKHVHLYMKDSHCSLATMAVPSGARYGWVHGLSVRLSKSRYRLNKRPKKETTGCVCEHVCLCCWAGYSTG